VLTSQTCKKINPALDKDPNFKNCNVWDCFQLQSYIVPFIKPKLSRVLLYSLKKGKDTNTKSIPSLINVSGFGKKQVPDPTGSAIRYPYS
jgi:hypothetical protein